MNELLLELSEQVPAEAGRQFLDLGTADVLEEQLKHLINAVDELNQVNIQTLIIWDKIFTSLTFFTGIDEI